MPTKPHLAYCLNVHPGEAWADNLAAIRGQALRVRDLCGFAGNFGLGLRLGARAAAELARPERLREFRAFLAAEGLEVFTVNAFPYGEFHRQPVREAVYRPDWRTPERLTYTLEVAGILAGLLPDGVEGSISTLPGAFRTEIRSQADREAVLANILAAAAGLETIRRRSGRRIRLAIEPEPACLWESTDEMIGLLAGELPGFAARRPPLFPDLEPAALLRGAIGVCFDCCHAAVRFEEPATALGRLLAAGVGAPKVQLSAAPACGCTPAGLARLALFNDRTYLHQSYIHNPADGAIQAFLDLPEALAAARRLPENCELRSHFHLPLTFDRWEELVSTRRLLDAGFFGLLRRAMPACHFETETYTYAVLPDSLRPAELAAMLAAELSWARAAIDGAAAER